MTDCPNAEMRDRLPDLLHERLETSVRAAVLAHIDECDDCRAEMVLLREARIVLSPEMRVVDVVAISRVVIEKTRTPVKAAVHRSRWMDWRIAASIAVTATPSAAPNGARPETLVTAPMPRSETSATVSSASAELSAAAPVGDLSESDLRALLRDLDQIDAVPPTEPEQVNVRVSLPGSSE